MGREGAASRRQSMTTPARLDPAVRMVGSCRRAGAAAPRPGRRSRSIRPTVEAPPGIAAKKSALVLLAGAAVHALAGMAAQHPRAEVDAVDRALVDA
jgi:hypothetical protein